MKYWLMSAFALSLFTFIIWIEIGVWRECLNENSFWYCMRLMSK